MGIPAFTEMIAEGKRQQVFSIGDSGATAELLLRIAGLTAEENYNRLMQSNGDTAEIMAVVRNIDNLLQAIERILGVEPNSLTRPEPSFIRKLSSAFSAKEAGPDTGGNNDG